MVSLRKYKLSYSSLTLNKVGKYSEFCHPTYFLHFKSSDFVFGKMNPFANILLQIEVILIKPSILKKEES